MNITLTWNGKCYEWTIFKEDWETNQDLIDAEDVIKSKYGSVTTVAPQVEYGMSASGKKEYSVRSGSVSEVKSIVEQLDSGVHFDS